MQDQNQNQAYLEQAYLEYVELYNRLFGKEPLWLSANLNTEQEWQNLKQDLLDLEPYIREASVSGQNPK